MSILSTKKPSETQKLSKRERQAEVDARWLNLLTREVLLTRLQQVRDEILDLDFVIRDPEDALTRENVAAMFARVIDLAQQVDVTQGTAAQRTEVYNAFYGQLMDCLNSFLKPSIISKSFTETINDTVMWAGNFKYKMAQIYKSLVEVHEVQRDLALPALNVGEITDNNPTQFPVILHESKEILAAVKSLQAMWERSAARNLTVSDRFTVDAIATSYLPDSLRLLQNLSRYSAESKAESEQIFLQHVGLLQRQLEQIFKQDELNEISAMRAHTLFLESKLA